MIKPQDELDPILTRPALAAIWFNAQIDDTGPQKKINGDEMPFVEFGTQYGMEGKGLFQSAADQLPLGEGLSNAIVVSFGPAGVTDDGNISVDAGGVITVVNSGIQYSVSVTLRVGRDSGTGTAEMLAWQELSLDGGLSWGQPAGTSTQVIEIDDATTVNREVAHFSIPASLPANAKIRVRFARGEGGPDEGGLYSYTPANSFTGLNVSPSAELEIDRIEII